MNRHEFISLFGGIATAWSLAAHAQDSATMWATKAILPQIEVARVKPVDRMPPNPRLSDDLIDLMKDFSLSRLQGIGGAWEAPPYTGPANTFDERYGRWCNHVVPGPNRLPWFKYTSTSSPCSLMR
jgi:hypothetical protein